MLPALFIEAASVDIEDGIIDRIILFARDLVAAGIGRIDHGLAKDGGKADLAGAGAVLRAEGTHARAGRQFLAAGPGIAECGFVIADE